MEARRYDTGFLITHVFSRIVNLRENIMLEDYKYLSTYHKT